VPFLQQQLLGITYLRMEEFRKRDYREEVVVSCGSIIIDFMGLGCNFTDAEDIGFIMQSKWQDTVRRSAMILRDLVWAATCIAKEEGPTR